MGQQTPYHCEGPRKVIHFSNQPSQRLHLLLWHAGIMESRWLRFLAMPPSYIILLWTVYFYLQWFAVKATEDKTEFFADRLKSSMQGAGANDTQLIWIIVSRSEVSLSHAYFLYIHMHCVSQNICFWRQKSANDYRKVYIYLTVMCGL